MKKIFALFETSFFIFPIHFISVIQRQEKSVVRCYSKILDTSFLGIRGIFGRGLLMICIVCSTYLQTNAQKTLTEATIVYNMAVEDATDASVANMLNNATLTLYIKGLMARTDFKSSAVSQSVIFNGKDNTATILKEMGSNKFLINLTKANWNDFNQKYDDIKFVIGSGTKTILGYECKEAVATLKDQSTFTVYFTTALTMPNKEYNRQFAGLLGVPLEYGATIKDWKVKYTATKLNFNLVPADKFELPTSGYRVLQYGKEAL